MITITKEQIRQIREDIAAEFGIEDVSDVRCLYCKSWGWNRCKVMNSVGESACKHRKRPDNKTTSYQWCKKFDYYKKG